MSMIRSLLLLPLLLWFPALPAALPAASPAGNDLTAFARSSNAFGLDLWRRLPTSGNQVFSPASVTTALVMTWGGARGETAAEMKKVLHIEATSDDMMAASGRLSAALTDPKRPVVFRIANRLFGEATFHFEAPFLDATRSAYGAPLESVDFRGAPARARTHINDWVEANTEKRITGLIPPGGITDDTRLVLTNAIYFLGDWQVPFAKEATQPAPFHLSLSVSKDVPTMQRTGSLRHTRGDGLAALELSYKGGDLSMLILLPDAVDGLPLLEKKLTTETLDRIVGRLTPADVAVMLPKFEVNPASAIALAPVLKAMGMPLAFDRERANFTGIAKPSDPHDRLYIGNVFHKAFVKTDEKGTEAAAATAVGMLALTASIPREAPIPFTADHPFLFLIRDNASGAVLFMGRVADPSVLGPEPHDPFRASAKKILQRYPALKFCSEPSLADRQLDELASEAFQQMPPGAASVDGVVTLEAQGILVADGCSVTIFANSDRTAYWVSLAGGITGNLRTTYGPLKPGLDF